ncbi:MAG TPA: hypothetical protein VFP43_22530 [Mesorhizobium sp.]|nr:hypothetical protein [Mesorhizobium sp.]
MDPEKEHLEEIADRVHNALRKLKMGESGSVACDKEHKRHDVEFYLMAYAKHKNKCFDVKYDAVSELLHCVRVEVPPLKQFKEDEDPDEI